MKSLSDYEKQHKVDLLAWWWFPRSIAFWVWFSTTLMTWKTSNLNLDQAATLGLFLGIVTWIIAKLATWQIGESMTQINLWEYGCGCLVRTISIELFHYIAIAIICILAINSKEISILTALGIFIIGTLNWLLISIKNL